MQKIIVIGGNGFLGKHLLQKLRKYKFAVFAPCRAEVDLTKPKTIAEYFTRFRKVDYLVDLAGIIPCGKHNPMDFYTVNVIGVANLCRYVSFQNFIYASTEDVYGPSGIFSESSATFPQNHYALSKIAGEMFVGSCEANSVILRFAPLYGEEESERTHSDQFIHKCMKQAVLRKPIELWGIGQRDYLYVEDAAEVIISCIINLKHFSHEIFNIGYGQPLTKIQIAEEIAYMSSNVVRVLNTVDSDRLMLTTKAEKMLGFHPINWKEGLRKTFLWWKIRRTCCDRSS